jgi:hypothetical protein
VSEVLDGGADWLCAIAAVDAEASVMARRRVVLRNACEAMFSP